jgi:integrase
LYNIGTERVNLVTKLRKQALSIAIEFKASRDVPLSRRAIETLRQLRVNDPTLDRVFPITGNAVRLAFEHLRVRAGMSDFHFHDLRHEAISRLFEKGLNIAEVTCRISG